MNEERMRVLRLLETGKINAAEAAALLEALAAPAAGPTAGGGRGGAADEGAGSYRKPRLLRIEIDDATGKSQRFKIPLSAAGIVRSVLSVGDAEELGKLGIDLEALLEAVRGGAEGTIADVQDRDGCSVRISVK
jgi:hypothetical protein